MGDAIGTKENRIGLGTAALLPLAALVVAALLVAGCEKGRDTPDAASGGERTEERADTETGEGWTSYAPLPCSRRDAEPITEQAALRALRANGIAARFEEGCPKAVASVLTNIPPADDDGLGAAEVLAREGTVSCFLYRHPRDGAPSEVVRRGADGADAELFLANLDCAILADSPEAELRIARLKQAFEELERGLR
jgi:hypothetical protein